MLKGTRAAWHACLIIFSPDVLADAHFAAIRWVGHELLQLLCSEVSGAVRTKTYPKKVRQ